jgi:hypothetical protein
MARTFNGTTQSIECTAPVTAVPLTIACWVNTSSPAAQVICSVGASGAVDRFQISFLPNSPVINATTVQGATVGSASLNTSIALNTWHHVAGVFSATNSRQVFFNGTGSTVNTTTVTPSGISLFNISGALPPSLVAFFAGGTAEVLLWNDALTAEEIAALAKGFNPRLIRPQSRVYWNRLIRESQDIQRGAALTDIGGATSVSTHPRIIYP